MALGLPITLAISAFAPELWIIGAVWVFTGFALVILDGFLATPLSHMEPEIKTPAHYYVGEPHDIWIRSHYENKTAPRRTEFRLSTNKHLRTSPDLFEAETQDDTVLAVFQTTAKRRGTAQVKRLWQRWQGPLGLIWRQRIDTIDKDIPITPNTQLITQSAIEIFSRDARFGQKIQKLKGDGTEFDSLTEFIPGMDKRHIDWKHSARHHELLAREYRTERNHNIIFAFDSGYLMCEEMEDSKGQTLTKLDRALTAALLMGFVSLKIGDRVGLYAFDTKPYLFTPAIAGTQNFAHLQRLSADIDYSTSETNFTLGLTQLGQNLKRRTLIIVFTDFIDTTQAELMIENIGRLLKRHIVIFVAFRNQPLEKLISRTPKTPKDVSESVVAETLMRERDLVIAKLSRMGVNIVDADPDTVNMAVLNSYLDLKARNVI